MHLLRFAQLPTHLGPMLAAWSDAGVVALSRSTDLDAFLSGVLRRIPNGRAAPADGPEAQRLAASINAYLEGAARRIAAEVDLTGLPGFDAGVYRAVIAIPYGATETYGEIAARVGSPRAARAVGNAMARCPLFPLVPCHRVVSATGLGGWGSDPSLKRRLLDMERGAGAPGPPASGA
jgi:O-6-methylguanine DNA methyltransferase